MTRRRVNSTAGDVIALLPVILLWLIVAVMIMIAVAVSSSLGCGWSGTCGIRYDPR